MEEIDSSKDFEISKRYIEFSSELLRLSLLSITGICYLVFVSAPFKNNISCNVLTLFIVSLSLFILASGLALAHRFYATDALSYQIAFLRKNKKKQWKGFINCLQRSKFYIILCQYIFVLAICTTFYALIKSKY
jgi:hypothetical protein